MHTASLLAAAFLAAASVATAEPARPKIYFPRQVKRAYVNSTITQTDPHPHPTPAPTKLTETDAETTKREPASLSDLLDIDLSIGGKKSTSSSKSSSGVTTVVKIATVVVSPPSQKTPEPQTPEPVSSDESSASGSSESSGESTVSPNSTAEEPATTSDILLAPTGIVTSSSSAPFDLLAPIGTVVSDIVSGVTGILAPSKNATDPDTSAPAETTAPASPVETTAPATTDGPDPLLSLSIGLPIPSSPLISVPDSVSTPNATAPTDEPTVDPTPEPTNILPTLPTDIVPTLFPTDPSSTVPSPTDSTPTDLPLPTDVVPVPTNGTTTEEPPVTLPPTSIPTSDLPLPTEVTIPTNVTEPVPTSIPDATLPPTETDLPIPTAPPANGTTNATVPETTVLPPPETTAPLATPTSLPMTSVPATGTISDSQPWIPTTIIIQAPTTAGTNSGLAPTGNPGYPTGLPKAITPDNGNTPLPEDSVEIQIAFAHGLNYDFVAKTPRAAAQVLKLVPSMLSYSTDFDESKVLVRKLIPYNTTEQLGFVTTLAITSYPKKLVDQLRLDMHAPNAGLWQNPDRLVYNMTQQINPAIDIILGSTLEGASDADSGSGSNNNNKDDMFNGDEPNKQSASQRGTSAAIAVGAIGVAAAYGAAMFIIARRYKKKKATHRRASSITTPSEMRETSSPALMGGALLSRDFTSTYGGVAAGATPGGRDSHGSGRSAGNNSGRTQMISAPVAAENSLGWN